MSRVMQLLHVESVKSGNLLQWKYYPEPEPELLAWFDAAKESASPEWADLEPEFTLT